MTIFHESHGEGPTLLLTHGYCSTSRMWRGQVDALSGSHRVVVWDMLGHGRSSSPPDPGAYSEDASVSDMRGILDAVGVERAVVGGLSLGGYMSLAFCDAHPDRVSGLVLVDTGPGFRKDEARDGWNQRAHAIARRIEKQGLEYLSGLGAEVSPSDHVSARGLVLAAKGMLVQRDGHVMEALRSIEVPTLVVVGAKDRPFLAAADYMAERIPRARKVVIEDAGHAVNLHQAERFNAVLAEFLEEVAPAPAVRRATESSA